MAGSQLTESQYLYSPTPGGGGGGQSHRCSGQGNRLPPGAGRGVDRSGDDDPLWDVVHGDGGRHDGAERRVGREGHREPLGHVMQRHCERHEKAEAQERSRLLSISPEINQRTMYFRS